MYSLNVRLHFYKNFYFVTSLIDMKSSVCVIVIATTCSNLQ